MFTKRQIAVGALLLATALTGCGGDDTETESTDTPTATETSAATTTPEASPTKTPKPKPLKAPTANATSAPGSPAIGSVTLTPGVDLADQQEVEVAVAGFGTFTGTASLVLCTPDVVMDPTNSDNYCDARKASTGLVAVSNGAGTGTFTILSGKSFKAAIPASKCGPAGPCLVVVSSATENPEFVAFSQVTFAG